MAGSTFTDAAGNNNTAADTFDWTKTTAAGITATWTFPSTGSTGSAYNATITSTQTGSSATGFNISSAHGSTYLGLPGYPVITWGTWSADSSGDLAEVVPENAGTTAVTLTAIGDDGESITFTPATVTVTMTCGCSGGTHTTKTSCNNDSSTIWNCTW